MRSNRHPSLLSHLALVLFCTWSTLAIDLPSGQYSQEPPIVIWSHPVKVNPLASLQKALASGIPNQVMLSFMHRLDADWRTSADTLKAIESVRQARVGLIWCRSLWPYYNNGRMGMKVLMDPQYYVNEIRMLQAEGQAIKADYIALDLEPGGRSPLKGLLKGQGTFTIQELNAIKKAVQQAVEQAGQVDFVLPAGSLTKDHPYNILSGLGRLRISQGTYYNNPILRRLPYDYEVFGAHVSCQKWRFARPGKEYFTVQDLLDRSQVWSDKRGLFIYTAAGDSTKVAEDLIQYSKALLARAYAR